MSVTFHNTIQNSSKYTITKKLKYWGVAWPNPQTQTQMGMPSPTPYLLVTDHLTCWFLTTCTLNILTYFVIFLCVLRKYVHI